VGGNYWERSPTFRADNGFENSNSWRLGEVWGGGILRFDDSEVLETISSDANVAQKWNFDGVKKDEWINVNLQLRFRAAQTSTHSRFMRSNELFGGIQFDNIWLAHTCFSTQPGGALRFGGYYDYGHRIARRDRVMGKEIVSGLWADIKPIDRLLISSSVNYTRSDDLDTDRWLFTQSVFRSRLSLQLTRELSARLVVQYNDSANPWGSWQAWDTDPLITYRINPFSIFYIGSTHDYRDLNQQDHGREGWTLTDRQYFMKVQYLFQL
jgi:hypothetical protein